MSNEFVSTEARGFRQSQCRARVTKVGGKFIFQFLQCLVYSHNSDASPWGGGRTGQDATVWPNAMDAGPYLGLLTNLGATQEFWNAFIHPFPQPNDPFLGRSLFPPSLFFSPAVKLIGDFGWRTGQTFSGPIVWRKLIAYRYKVTYLPFTAPAGQVFPGGQFEEGAHRFTIHPAASGTVTYHSLVFDGTKTYDGGLILWSDFGARIPVPSPVTIQLPKRMVYLDAGHPVQEFFPDAPVEHVRDFTSSTAPYGTSGTLELAIFWFERKPSDLPSFPYLMDPSGSVV